MPDMNQDAAPLQGSAFNFGPGVARARAYTGQNYGPVYYAPSDKPPVDNTVFWVQTTDGAPNGRVGIFNRATQQWNYFQLQADAEEE